MYIICSLCMCIYVYTHSRIWVDVGVYAYKLKLQNLYILTALQTQTITGILEHTKIHSWMLQ